MTDPTIDSVRRHAIPVDLDTGLNRVVDLIGDARLVLLGEASHVTHEFYRARADITRELITHHGFNLIAVNDYFVAEQNARVVQNPRCTTARCSAATSNPGTCASAGVLTPDDGPGSSIGAHGASARAGDRRNLPARHGASQPLFPRAPTAPVRRDHPHRHDQRGQAARNMVSP